MSPSFKWIRLEGRDRLRKNGFILVMSSAIAYYGLSITDTALHETDTVTTNAYFTIGPFFGSTANLFELLLLGIILRTLCGNSCLRARRWLNKLQKAMVILLAMLSATIIGFSINQAVWLANSGYYYIEEYIARARYYVQLTYTVLLLVVAIYACVIAVYTLIYEWTKTHPFLLSSTVMLNSTHRQR
ncbi:hypothetical protein BJ878DRAFT_30498 [Calycina marina]|uniref:Uncharacterized protein n=1 Tax=Calycina marina TaxID=1763456 RepID=A0A9P7Z4P5_9HELO|nr:hypothetical protein BJ878DRAFT_30498 [Calycina marina]